MGGGLMQLVAYGAQDIYLTGNPQITFFKVVYRRHTNFAMESIMQTFNGAVDFGRKVSCTIARNGDLVGRMYLEVLVKAPQLNVNVGSSTAPSYKTVAMGGAAKAAFMHKLGNGLIKSVECEIGGQSIDKQYGEWMELWSQLTDEGYGNRTYDQLVTTSGFAYDDETGKSLKLYIPLQFWFCYNPGLALPLIALQYHEVKINLHLEELNNVMRFDAQNGVGNEIMTAIAADLGGGLTKNNIAEAIKANRDGFGIACCDLYCDYIYLDTDERRRFAQVSHEYLITQTQFSGNNSVSCNITNTNICLDLNHPVKELVWVVENETHSDPTDIVPNTPNCIVDPADRFTYLNGAGTMPASGNSIFNTDLTYPGKTSTAGAAQDSLGDSLMRHWDQVESAVLQLNGHDRFARRHGKYFKWVQPYQHHSNAHPGVNNVYVYSFALKPEEHQPSGTCNFSRIDNAVLDVQLFPSKVGDKSYLTESAKASGLKCKVDRRIRVYATNYNVLRVMSGMGGLAYSN